jgi:hypothetical protein
MNMQFKSLYESVVEHGGSQWELVVFTAVEQALKDLGPAVYSIEWANKHPLPFSPRASDREE